MMDHRDEWPDGILEGDLAPTDHQDSAAHRSTERIARDARNMNALLNAMADELSEALPAAEDEEAVQNAQAVHPRRRASWGRWTLGPVAAAAAVAALILVRGEGIEESAGPESSAVAPYTPSMVSEIDAEADRPFVVFPTSDPDIAVVWLLNPKESD